MNWCSINGIICEYATNNCTCSLSACRNIKLCGNTHTIQEEKPSPWHTGTPTEEGDYLVKLDVEHHVYPYYVLKWNKGGWYSHYDMDYPACPQHSVLKWQKIKEASK